MASEIKSDKLSPSTGTALQIGDASDTITIPTGATFTITDGLGVAGGGTGLTGFTAGDVLYATGTTTLAKLAKGTAEQVLAMNSGATAPDWGSVDLTVLPTITVAKGGTNLTSFTAGDILYATGSTTLAKLAKGSGSDTLKMNSGATAPEWVTVAAATSELTHLKTISASDVASVEFVDGASGVVFDGTYREYLLKVTNYWSNGTGSAIECQITNDAGTTYETSGYNLIMERAYYSGPAGGSPSVKTDCIWSVNFGPATVGTGAMCSFEITFSKPTLTTFPDAKGFFWGAEAAQALLGMSHGRYEVSAAYDGFKIYQEGGVNFTARFDLYGIKEN